MLGQLLRKFLCHLRVVIGMDVAQRIFDCQRLIRPTQVRFAARCAAIARVYFRVFRQFVIKL